KCAVLRAVVGAKGGHDAVQCLTGWGPESLRAMGGRPSLGAVVAKLQGPTDPSVPPFVGLAAKTQHMPWSDAGQAGFLGVSYSAFKPDGPGMANLKLKGVTAEQLADRQKLRKGFDGMRADLDQSGALKSIDSLTERALGVLTSSKLLDAL